MGPNEQLRYVKVTNGLDVPFVDRYDGVPVTIPPGKSENIPPDMAWHFFGYVEGAGRPEMFRHTAKRRGWNTVKHLEPDPATGKPLAEALFDKLKIEPVMYKMVPVEEGDPQKPIPADPEGMIEPPTIARDDPESNPQAKRGPFGRPPKRVNVDA